jgi:hypothetical protein
MQAVPEALAAFEHLAGTVARMVELARTQQWQQLSALDAQCAALFARLRAQPQEALTPWERTHLAALVERIQADQDVLARLVRPQFLRLVRSLQA